MTTRLDAYERMKQLMDVWAYLRTMMDMGEPDNICYYLDSIEVRFRSGTAKASIAVDGNGNTYYEVKLTSASKTEIEVAAGEDRYNPQVIKMLRQVFGGEP